MAEDDEATTNEGESITINVIDNDMDEGGSINPNSVSIVQPRHVANFDGIDDKITWGNLGLDGTPRISKFIRFRTTRAGGALFDYERNTRFDGGFGFRDGHLQLRCGFQGSALPSSMWYRLPRQPMGNGIVSDLPTMETP